MQQPPSDLAFAQAVLEGQVTTRGPWHAHRQPSGSTRGVKSPGRGSGRQAGRADGGRQAGTGGAKRWRHLQQQQPKPHSRQRQPQQHRTASTSPSGSQGSSSGSSSSDDSGLAAFSRPGPQSTARAAHCTACNVWVPRRAGDWEVHVAGIRHRRQLLSLRVHGERNRLVLSAFESLPGSAEAVQRLVGKAAQDFKLASGNRPRGAAAAEPELLAAAGRLRTEALKQLLNMFGVGQVYNAAAAGFAEQRLTACLQQQQASGRASGSCSTSTWTLEDGAELAALAELATAGRLAAAQLTIKLLPPGADAPRSQHAGLAAALPLLVAALHRSGSLQALQLELPPTQGSADAARLAELWQQAWQHTLPALRALLESSAPLRTLRMLLPASLHSSTAAYLPQLRGAAAAAPVAVRSQVLLALHPRAGRCSLLQLLPLQVVREVLDLAAPLGPCAIQLAALPG